MTYQRPKSEISLSSEQKKQLIQDYIKFYEVLAKQNDGCLNIKISREVFSDFLDKVGCMLLDESKKMAEKNLKVKKFLDKSPLPESMQNLLPDDFRVFCLILNALKQWVSAEQLATDRYLFGGTARETVRSFTDHCLVTGDKIDDKCEHHHPVRDGRPPILLSKDGHAQIEGQTKIPEVIKAPAVIKLVVVKTEDITTTIKQIRKESNRSWHNLQNACLEDLGKEFTFSTVNVRNSSRSVLKRIKKATGLTSEQILKWIGENT